MNIKPIPLIVIVIALIASYYILGAQIFPIILFVIVLLWITYLVIFNNGTDKIVCKFENILNHSDNINKTIKELDNGEHISNDNEKNIAKEVIEKYKSNLKYIEENYNKILIYPIEGLSTIHFWEIFWGKNEYIPSYKNKKPIFDISIDGILYNGKYFFEWSNIQGLKKIKGPFGSKYSPENNSSQALKIEGFYFDREENTLGEGEDLINMHESSLIYYELMGLPQTINMTIGVIERFMKKNDIQYGNKPF